MSRRLLGRRRLVRAARWLDVALTRWRQIGPELAMGRSRRRTGSSVQRRLAALHGKALNYDPNAPHPAEDGWRIDEYCEPLPREAPGPPEDGGPFAIAQTLLRDYRVADPDIVRAYYDEDAPLEGRDMLLELRFLFFRTYAGCRVGDIVDETREVDGRPVRVWGWPYRTLEGHVEQGEMSWEVWKWLDTGEVEFRIHSYSRLTGAPNPLTRVGIRLIGQRERRRYLSSACRRIARLTAEGLRGRHPAGAQARRDAGGDGLAADRSPARPPAALDRIGEEAVGHDR
jgi:uncharacterized protein (UPF0548 family)